MKILGISIVACVLVLLQWLVYKKLWDRNLYVSVFFQQSGVVEGEEGEVIEIIENRKRLPLTMLKVKFQTSRFLGFIDAIGSKTTDQYYRNDVFQVSGGERITRRLRFRANKRGYYHIKNIDLVATDLFFLSEHMKNMTTEHYLYVYPKILRCDVFRRSLQKLNGEILVKRHMLEDPFEYRGIREYQPYDDIRSVNWKATARTGDLKVNQKNYTAMQTIRIFLNLEDDGVWKKEKELEASLQIVMGIAQFFLSQGMKVSCHANGRDILTDEHMEIRGISGIAQLDVLGKALARVDLSKKPKPFCELFERSILEEADGFFTFVVSPNGYKDFIELLKKAQAKKILYLWYYPKLSYEKPTVPVELEKQVQFVAIE